MLRVYFGCCLWFMLAGGIAVASDPTPANLIAGKKVPANARLRKGDKLVAWYEKKAYLVEITDVKADGKVKIFWVETKEESEDVAPNELYEFGDSSTLRRSKTAALPEAYRSYDKNADGQISLSEWDRSKYPEFRRLDKNNDGFLVPKELTAKSSSTSNPQTPIVATTIASTAVPTTTNAPPAAEPRQDTAPAPIDLQDYADKFGQTFTFKVTANAAAGEVVGSGSYGLGSKLAAAVVHAGILKNGQSGEVAVTIVANVEKFAESTANGVTSIADSDSGPAFTLKAAASR